MMMMYSAYVSAETSTNITPAADRLPPSGLQYNSMTPTKDNTIADTVDHWSLSLKKRTMMAAVRTGYTKSKVEATPTAISWKLT